MLAPPRPAGLEPTIESTDLGDMLELRQYDVARDRTMFRWRSLVDGQLMDCTPGDYWSPSYGDALPRLEAMRDRAREVFLST